MKVLLIKGELIMILDDTKNEKLGLIIDLSRKLEAINKRLKVCEEEIEKWNKEKLRLEREAEKLIERINKLSLELHEREGV